ncbi:hypothetical protein [Ensifer sp. BR816]|uniref:hypothetical protein n=1 Tax=Rhizobium sp. (strain BR816) TaxID=1057002 RepID=UPI00036FED30|nr:hypothetical protein [Ensifer sp. BR816]
MPSIPIRPVRARGLSVADETNIVAFVAAAAEPDNPVLIFTGDRAQRPEADDVAAVRPELLQFIRGRLRGGVVRRPAKGKVKARSNVVVPSLVIMGRKRPAVVLGNVRGGSKYVDRLGAWLSPGAPVMVPSGRPKVEITHAGKEIVR